MLVGDRRWRDRQEGQQATIMLDRLKPMMPSVPKLSNKKPPTTAPTIPRAISSQKPRPRLCTIWLPMSTAISPSTIQAIREMGTRLPRVAYFHLDPLLGRGD